MKSFATLDEVIALSGATYNEDEQTRIETLLPLVSDVIRFEAEKVGKSVDNMIFDNQAYKSVVKLVTVDVIVRIMRQATTGEPMSQMSQSALGYSVSGTYAIPGGGMAISLMDNDKKKLGFKVQKYGGIDLWPRSKACK